VLANYRIGLRLNGWFASHMNFASLKSVRLGHGVELELRRALEPWNVLAEETSSGRTVRNVDSSIERIQVKVSSRAQIPGMWWCNGRAYLAAHF